MERLRRAISSACIPLLICLILFACQKAPITGRSQLILIPESMEIEMGLTAYRDVLKKAKLSTDTRAIEMLRRVGGRIAAVTGRSYEWEFNLIDNDKVVNAFALPGGKVAVYTGILKYTQDETGLATVLSHEIAHVLLRHGGERISAGLLTELGMLGLNMAIKKKDPGTIRAINEAFGVGVNVGVLLPFSRLQELEADRVGLILMAKAGYDPHGAVAFWERMLKAEKGAPPEFLSTHPATKRRIEEIKEWIPVAMKYYRKHN